jgi:threonyl-tRNA synthetase
MGQLRVWRNSMDVGISEGFARNVISASFNGTCNWRRDGPYLIHGMMKTEKKLLAFDFMSWRKSLNKCILVKLTLGPAISNGFYYDIDFEESKWQDFKKIEDSILEISKHEFKLRPVSKADALELYKDNVYKTEMITNLEDGTITFCDHDTFTDLCRGGYRIPVLSKR